MLQVADNPSTLKRTSAHSTPTFQKVQHAGADEKCGNCKTSIATIKCETCSMLYCNNCSETVHINTASNHVLQKQDISPLRASARHQHTIGGRGVAPPIPSRDTNTNVTTTPPVTKTPPPRPPRMIWKKNDMFVSALSELITTEKLYITNLETLKTDCLIPIQNGSFAEFKGNPAMIVCKSFQILLTRKTIQSCVDELMARHTQLQDAFEVENAKDIPDIGAAFLQNIAGVVNLYSVYCNHCEEVREQLRDVSAKNTQLYNFLQDVIKTHNGRDIFDFLAVPFQRILKYSLIFDKLTTHADTTYPYLKELQEAKDKMDAEASVLNQNKADADNHKKILDLYNSLDGCKIKLLEKGRRLIKEGPCIKISKSKEQERYLFLFTDMLIYTNKSLVGSSYQYRGTIELDKCLVTDVADTEGLQNAFQITRDNGLVYIMVFMTPKEKSSWFNLITSLKEQFESNMVMTGKPIWQHDLTVDNCINCNAKFRMLNRRHHCRHCGRIFCGLCSNYEIELPSDYGYTGLQRVCLECYKILSRIQAMKSPKSPRETKFGGTSMLNPDNPEASYKAGFLVKKGHNRRNWSRRYFVLEKGVLEYFDGMEEQRKSKGSISVKDYNISLASESITSYKWCFSLHGPKDFLIRAENQKDFDEWWKLLVLLVKPETPNTPTNVNTEPKKDEKSPRRLFSLSKT